AGFAIGLAFQGTLSNFAAGILLMVFRPFRVGDVVNVATVTGKVNEIDLFTTTLDTPDNRRLIIPNSAIAGTTIENLTYHKHRRVDVTVGISYAADLDRSRTVLQNCISLHEDKLISGDGRGAQVLLTALNSSSVDWTVRFWTAAENFHAVKELLTVEIKRQLDLAGLEIPFPQMHLHVSRRVDDAFVDTPSTEAEPAPIPKMLTLPASNNGRVRPRARG
ncbi:MAG: mechanosensitive ion channel, partial [Planctomycetales bacterium]|nr:mechanosensitive ion channel [Planctomycetales bacterium]